MLKAIPLAGCVLALAAFAAGPDRGVDRARARFVAAPAPQVDLPTPVRAIMPSGEVAPEGSLAIEVDRAAWMVMDLRDAAWLEEVPLSDGSTVDLRLSRVLPFAPGARIVEMVAGPGGRPIERSLELPAISAWSGSVAGAPDSRAFVALSEAGLHGFIQMDGRTEYIASGDPQGGQPTLVTASTALAPSDFTCGGALQPPEEPLDALHADGPPEVVPMLAAACRQLNIAFETDQEMLAKFGNNTTTASAYVATLTAALVDIYSRDFNLRPALSYLRWWSTTDPWTQTGTCGGTGTDQLGELRSWWNTNMQTTPRHVTAMLSGRGLGGGCAWLNSVCASNTSGTHYSVSANLSGSFPYPVVSRNASNWDLIVVSHEIGHNVGAQHTHDLGVDDCYTGSGLGACTQRTSGTIMSYCHLCSGGVSNINMNFAQANIDQVVPYVAGRSCTSPTVAAPVAVANAFTAQEGTESVLDILANDLPSNCDSISIDALPASSTLGVPLVLDPTAAPGGGPAVRYLPSAGVSGADSFTYRVLDAAGQASTTVTVSIDVRPTLMPFEGLVRGQGSGLRARYYNATSLTALPDFDALTPFAFSGTVANLGYTTTTGACVGSGLSDNVAAVFEGWVDVPTTGSWLWSLTSDAGSQLWIDGRLVVNHDGIHSYSEKTATIQTLAGRHFIQVRYFETTGSCGLLMRWTPPGGTKVTIPAANLSQGGVLPDLDGSGVIDAGDIGSMLLLFGADCSATTTPCYTDPYNRQRIGAGPCDCQADLDGSGAIDAGDIGSLLLHFG
ncbi:MAG: hypothetical protein EBQ99_05685 [Planctomycetes bacterium]|nr:hypothetical protein [Planctomycetota bacterium]